MGGGGLKHCGCSNGEAPTKRSTTTSAGTSRIGSTSARRSPTAGRRSSPTARRCSNIAPRAAPRALTYGELASAVERAGQGAAAPGHEPRRPGGAAPAADASRRRSPMSAIYKLGAIAVPLALLFGVEALEYRLQTAGVQAVVTNAAGLAKLGAHQRDGCPTSSAIVSIDGAAGGALRFPATGRRPFGRSSTPRTRRRRSGDDDLHLGHDRAAEGRAAWPSGAARPSARRADAITSSCRSRATGCGRRPTGPGPAGCSTCCCRRSISAFRWSSAPVREIRSGSRRCC